MQVLRKTKIGPFLVISSVLAVWALLAAQPVQSHTTALPTPSCSGLPADDFFTSTAAITGASGGQTLSSITTQQGVGSTTRERLRYAKITIPALAAGELRVFATTEPSDAALCRGGSQRANSRTSYGSHNSARSAAVAADRAADNTNISESNAKSALRSAAAALTTVANALAAAGHNTEAGTARDAATAATAAAATTADGNTTDETGALSTAADALEAAANVFHTGFQIRAEVRPGDESYVLVVAVDDATQVPTLAGQFHGAIEVGDAATREGLQGALDAGEVEDRSILITAPGLLTLETTGNTDTVGMFGANPNMFESGGSGGNFKMVLPVEADTTAQTLTVEGQTPTTTGSYTLNMDFEVAMSTPDPATQIGTPAGITVAATSWPASTAIADDDTTLQIDGSSDADYFVFTSNANGFLIVEGTNASGTTSHSDTSGELYGPTGEIATATGGNGNHFRFRVPVNTMPYLVKVTGTTGQYALRFAFQTATTQGSSAASAASTAACPGTPADPDGTAVNLICPSASTGQQERDRYLIDIMEPGTLYVHTTGSIRTRGVLYGPDGGQLGEDTGSASDGINFRIVANVNPGLHVVEVRGYDRQTTGPYGLVTNFVAGDVDPTTPTTPGTGGDLQDEIDRLRALLAACEEPVETDATGYLGNPANGAVVSGIGVISGWVCAAEEIEVKIYSRGSLREILKAAHGTSRPDTVGECSGHNSPNTGFGMTFNFNHLDEGEYTIRAFADDEPLPINVDGDMEATFEVVHLVDFAANDMDRFLRDLPDGECRAPDFPARGETTLLKWEESLQNFTVHNVLDQ